MLEDWQLFLISAKAGRIQKQSHLLDVVNKFLLNLFCFCKKVGGGGGGASRPSFCAVPESGSICQESVKNSAKN